MNFNTSKNMKFAKQLLNMGMDVTFPPMCSHCVDRIHKISTRLQNCLKKVENGTRFVTDSYDGVSKSFWTQS
jgi:hypothetical protein